MADIIELRRGVVPVRLAPPEQVVAPLEHPWALPLAMFQLGVVVWANWWFAPLGLRVERSESGPFGR
ncbi:MAG TPA: hypothetical protein VHL31_03525 [Geminicoccus sp.]|jgi:hypothetical protein|uniref:hypothetical protein n=1 Tax=Geminicoccus sp. TaxID=2024832 RepID=UPI002E2FF201|nr:hypothetical protein [Geminicoccus sp.]HEX2525358.1 hypothetical protein [Geminicoccus sp.]